ncbi:unnamed protein product, partial [Staurois parvus]
MAIKGLKRAISGVTDTVLMALGRKGLTCGAIKGLIVCCFTVCCVLCVLHC